MVRRKRHTLTLATRTRTGQQKRPCFIKRERLETKEGVVVSDQMITSDGLRVEPALKRVLDRVIRKAKILSRTVDENSARLDALEAAAAPDDSALRKEIAQLKRRVTKLEKQGE